MDGVNRNMNPAIHNPLSAQFVNAATKNVSQQMGAIKKQDEIDTDEPAKSQELEDFVDISVKDEVKPEEHMEAASRTGLLSEMDETKKKDKQEKTKSITYYDGNSNSAEVEKDSGQVALKSEMEKTLEKLEKMGSTREKLDTIRQDVPPEKYDAAKKIVRQQIDTKTLTPSESLQAMKEVPDVSGVKTQAAEYHPIMDIHDTMNEPVAVGFE